MSFARQKKLFSTVLAFIFLLTMSPVSRAGVKEVTLFPTSAKVEATVKLHLPSSDKNNPQAVIMLPSQADPESLIIFPPAGSRMKIDDVRIKNIEHIDENGIAQLRAKIKKLQKDRQDMRARLQALDVQILFWQAQTKAKTKTVVDADNLASAIGRNTRKAYFEKYSIETELGKIDKQIKELQDELNRIAGRGEKIWNATITLSGPVSNNVELTYTYMLGGCGWQPLYRLEATPSAKSVLFSWDAEIWQSTGENWTLARINLATLQPAQTITPSEIPPWVIKPKTFAIYKSSARREKSALAALAMAEADHAAEQSAPVETVNTTYSIWSLGKKTVSAGSRQRFRIKEETWPAEFLFLSRPSLSPQAFLQAQIKLPKPVEIPSGQASFIIDGAMVGKRNFSLAGSEVDIYFGASPLVTVNTLTTAEKSGVASFLQNKQTRHWQWRIEAKNAGNSPIRLRIEEPVPQVRDERIKLIFKHHPEPAEKDSTKFIWVIDLSAMQKKIIETGVELEAPKDMKIDFGWRH